MHKMFESLIPIEIQEELKAQANRYATERLEAKLSFLRFLPIPMLLPQQCFFLESDEEQEKYQGMIMRQNYNELRIEWLKNNQRKKD